MASRILLVLSVALFVFAALGVRLDNAERIDFIAAGLATFAAAHLVP